jgi:UDP-glucuronate 4-epimerase
MGIFLFTDAVCRGNAINLFGDGTARRDWTFVGDTVRGVLAALDRPLGYEIINVGNSNTHTEMDVINAAEQASGNKAIINYLERPASEPKITFADISKARELLDFNPSTPFEDGFAKFYEWYQNGGKE